jgi:hypothetical protein
MRLSSYSYNLFFEGRRVLAPKRLTVRQFRPAYNTFSTNILVAFGRLKPIIFASLFNISTVLCTGYEHENPVTPGSNF